jgi:hypothetical protein
MSAPGAGGRGESDPRVPRNFYNQSNTAGVAEADLPPSAQANDFEDTQEYLWSTNYSGPEAKDRQDDGHNHKDPGWDEHGYYANVNFTTRDKNASAQDGVSKPGSSSKEKAATREHDAGGKGAKKRDPEREASPRERKARRKEYKKDS